MARGTVLSVSRQVTEIGPPALTLLLLACGASTPASPPPPAATAVGREPAPLATITIARDPVPIRRAPPPADAPKPGPRIWATDGFAIRACSDERDLRSLESQQGRHVEVANRTHGKLRVYWLDFSGIRTLYAELEPEAVWGVESYLSHPWLFADEADRCLGIAVPTRGDQQGDDGVIAVVEP